MCIDDMIAQDFNLLLKEKIDTDVLLLKGEKINGASHLAKHRNHCALKKMTKE